MSETLEGYADLFSGRVEVAQTRAGYVFTPVRRGGEAAMPVYVQIKQAWPAAYLLFDGDRTDLPIEYRSAIADALIKAEESDEASIIVRLAR